MYNKMRKMPKRKLSLIILCLNVILILSSCSKKVTPPTNITQKVVFIQQYINWAWGYQNQGFYIDGQGNIIKFDMSTEDKKYADTSNLLRFLEMQHSSPVSKTISKIELSEYYDYLYKINPNTKLKRRSVAVDAGGDSLYGVIYKDGKATIITIDSRGDWEELNPDEYAQKTKVWLRKLQQNNF